MKKRLEEIRLIKVNERVIVAPRDWKPGAVSKWFEKATEEEFVEGQLLQLDDRVDASFADQGETWAEVLAGMEFAPATLPLFLMKA